MASDNDQAAGVGWTTAQIARSGLFAALTAVSAQISIPLGPVPFSLQVMVSLLAGAVLGSRAGALSQIVYLLMGAIGLPVFALRQGGVAVLVGPTGGYLFGFALAAWIVGRLLEGRSDPTLVRGGLAMTAGLIAIHVPGALLLALHLDSIPQALAFGTAPYLPLDVVKAAAALAVARGLSARGVVRPARQA